MMECFFDYLNQFVSTMLGVFPGDKKLRTYASSLQLLNVAGEYHMRAAYEAFQKTLTPDVLSAVEARDEVRLKSLSLAKGDSTVLSEIQYIQERVTELTEAERQVVWEYIDCLVESACEIPTSVK